MDKNPGVASKVGNTDHVDKISAPSHESLIVQSVDINTKSTFYAGVAGASAKDQPKVNSNFRPLVADLVFDGVSISIPRKVVKKVNSEADLVDVVTIGIPSLTGDGLTKETIRVEYKWRPPMCDVCKIFGHAHDHCLKKVSSPPAVVTSNVVTPTIEKTNDGFQTVGKKKKRKGKSKSTNGGPFAGPLVKPNVRYELKKTTGASSKNDNIITSNSYSALNDDNEDEEEDVENVYDEMTNLFPNTKIDGSSSFTVAVG
ncbi:hypothetical protein Tco_1541468 [Tanacetum coccineum]